MALAKLREHERCKLTGLLVSVNMLGVFVAPQTG